MMIFNTANKEILNHCLAKTPTYTYCIKLQKYKIVFTLKIIAFESESQHFLPTRTPLCHQKMSLGV